MKAVSASTFWFSDLCVHPTGNIALNQCIYYILQDSTLFLSLTWYISCVFSRPFQYSVRLDDFVWCCYVVRPMVMGPLSQFLRCEVFPLVGCYVIWDSMSVGQILSPSLVAWLGLYGQERKTHTWNKYLLNACGDQLLAFSRWKEYDVVTGWSARD